jgi:2,5-diketo-D-gluconate reductase A
MNGSSTIELHTNNQMPIIGFGTWKLTGDQAVESVKNALKLGYRMVDTSGDYGNHKEVGDAMRASSVKRDDIYLVTKVEEDEDAYESTKANLAELGLEYADLMLIHRPPRDDGAGEVLWQGLIRAKNEGLVKDIGVSNYSIEQLQDLTAHTGEKPVVNQIEWSPFGYSKDMLDYCHRQHIVIQAYSPLSRKNKLGDPMLVGLSKKYGKTPAQVVLRWDIQHEVVPLPKATSEDHIRENLDVFDFEIEDEDMMKLDSLNERYSSLGSSPIYM